MSTTKLYLTVDDGPNKQTQPMAELLKEMEIKATFFLTGQQALRFPATMRAVHECGHEIGNHSFLHDALDKMTREDKRKDIENTQEAIFKVAGVRPTRFRPPYVAWKPEDNDILDELNLILETEFAGVGDATKEYMVNYAVAEEQLNRKRQFRDHVVVLIHNRQHTLDGLENLIEWYRQQDCVFVPDWPEHDPHEKI